MRLVLRHFQLMKRLDLGTRFVKCLAVRGFAAAIRGRLTFYSFQTHQLCVTALALVWGGHPYCAWRLAVGCRFSLGARLSEFRFFQAALAFSTRRRLCPRIDHHFSFSVNRNTLVAHAPEGINIYLHSSLDRCWRWPLYWLLLPLNKLTLLFFG